MIILKFCSSKNEAIAYLTLPNVGLDGFSCFDRQQTDVDSSFYEFTDMSIDYVYKVMDICNEKPTVIYRSSFPRILQAADCLNIRGSKLEVFAKRIAGALMGKVEVPLPIIYAWQSWRRL